MKKPLLLLVSEDRDSVSRGLHRAKYAIREGYEVGLVVVETVAVWAGAT